jgi:hypothetical protein
MPSSTTAWNFFAGVASTTGQFVTDSIPMWYLYLGVGIAALALGVIWWSFLGGAQLLLHTRRPRQRYR